MTTLSLPCRSCKHATEHNLESWGTSFIGGWGLDISCAKGIKPKERQMYEPYGARTKELGIKLCEKYSHIPQDEVF